LLQQSRQLAKEEEEFGIDDRYQIPDQLWKKIQLLLPPPPKHKRKDRPGRPRMDDRKAMNAIFYILRTGCQWNALPRSLGASSTVHDRFQWWLGLGDFERMWKEGLIEYNKKGAREGVAGPGRSDYEGAIRWGRYRTQPYGRVQIRDEEEHPG